MKVPDVPVVRKYWFELFHFAVWILVGALLFFQQMIGLPVALFAIVLCAVSFAINAFHRQIRSSLLILAAPLLALIVVLPLQSTNALNWVEFNLAKAAFQAKVDALPGARGEPRLTAFVMDDRGWQAVGPRLFEAKTYVNGDYILETLVYDESAEIARPPERRSDAWITRAKGRAFFIPCCNRCRKVTASKLRRWVEIGAGSSRFSIIRAHPISPPRSGTDIYEFVWGDRAGC